MSALDKDSTFSLADSFILFDYSKLSYKKWEYYPSANSYQFIELHPGKFVIGGWENPREAGANEYSIEDIWYNSPLQHSKYFKEANEEIMALLKQAMIS